MIPETFGGICAICHRAIARHAAPGWSAGWYHEPAQVGRRPHPAIPAEPVIAQMTAPDRPQPRPKYV